ncbi:MAG: glycosyltransferase family 2 protein [bacterium]|nr:glycosyltransferase family 2 protein [bacterium]
MKIKSKPLTLSLVIPVYNEEDHIEACLDSIASQSLSPLEVIVVDNGSTDTSVALAKRYDFVTLIHASQRGIAYARNAGFEAAQGDIIGRIDADTRLGPDWVEQMTEFLTLHPKELLTGGSYLYDLAWPKFYGWIQGQIAFRANRLILGHYIAWGSNMAFRRSLWDEIKYEVHNDPLIHEDIDLGMHLHDKGYKITYRPNLKVGIDSRLFSQKRTTREQHIKYLVMWPKTLEMHNKKRAWIGWAGVYLVYCSYLPLLAVNHIGKVYRYLIPADQEI